MLQPKETPLILTEGSIHCKDLRLKLTEFLFEKYNVPALFLCKDSVLSSFACGRSTALVLDCGNNRTVASPVHDGYALQKCIIKHDIGGATISNMLQEWLSKERKSQMKYRFHVPCQKHFICTRTHTSKFIKSKYIKSFIALDITNETKTIKFY